MCSENSSVKVSPCMQVIWGHEHECIRAAEKVNKFDVLQPGSTVATSLSEPESKPKHCFVLDIKGEHYRFDAVRLRTVRPFKFKAVRHCSLCWPQLVNGFPTDSDSGRCCNMLSCTWQENRSHRIRYFNCAQTVLWTKETQRIAELHAK
jgi:hypothetical protein